MTAPRLESFLRAVSSQIGTRAELIQPPDWHAAEGGSDADFVVVDLDELWPLRVLGPGISLCQIRHYESTSWQWVFDVDGISVVIDGLHDPDAVGRYGVSTDDLTSAEIPFAARRAAYLILKRLRKSAVTPEDWPAISVEGRRDIKALRALLAAPLGASVSGQLALACETGEAPSRSAWKRARLAQKLRRYRTPRRIARVLTGELRRRLERISRPNGLFVEICGPDGVGKSTLANALVGDSESLFRRVRRTHWRPGILPRPGVIFGHGAQASDYTDPHGRTPHGAAVSYLLLLYYWVDFVLGALLVTWPTRMRSGLLVVERGWLDATIDPKRYRLSVAPKFVRALGKLLPQPDLRFVLEADGAAAAARKGELALNEYARQRSSWRLFASGDNSVAIETTAISHADVARVARTNMIDSLSQRALGSLGSGWAGLPRRNAPRWVIPRFPRNCTAGGLAIYQPVTTRARVGWRLANRAARCGVAALLPRSGHIPREALEAIGDLVPHGGSVSFATANHANRVFALVLDRRGSAELFVKIALTPDAMGPLRAEVNALDELARELSGPLCVPTLHSQRENLVGYHAISWSVQRAPGPLPLPLASAIGEFARSGAAHGDFAPWNLLYTQRECFLVDWEEATREAPPFFDFWHYHVQAYALLGSVSMRQIAHGLASRGPVGRALAAYAEAAGLSSTDARAGLATYLAASTASADRFGSSRRGSSRRAELWEVAVGS